MLTTAPRGTKDILPRDVEAWRYLERTMREICAQYGYLEIRTPVFEPVSYTHLTLPTICSV